MGDEGEVAGIDLVRGDGEDFWRVGEENEDEEEEEEGGAGLEGISLNLREVHLLSSASLT